MEATLNDIIKTATNATSIGGIQEIQSLWSGYGSISRVELAGTTSNSVVVKHIKLPEAANHPRGWNTDISHQRKLRSYQVETYWYKHWAPRCDNSCTIPRCLATHSIGSETLIVLEDLDASGYPQRKSTLAQDDIHACISWLAHFHGLFMHQHPEGLWPIGTYWHLDTRPDELHALADSQLKQAAPMIDAKLNASHFRTIVHGDAKVANFCFSELDHQVAAVDFQYVGGGCGMKDLAYFLGSCLSETDCEKLETPLLDFYFDELGNALNANKISLDFDKLEAQWRSLYPVAWTDFHRFLKGWSPGHWKINDYSERLARNVIANLE